MQESQLERAILDINYIKRSMKALEDVKSQSIETHAFKAQLSLQVAVLVMCIVAFINELFFSYSFTSKISVIKTDPEFVQSNIVVLAIILILCLFNLYGVIWIRSRKSQEDFQSFLSRNFKYLLNIGHLSDLTIKLVMVSFLLVLQKPEWIPSLLLLFVGDLIVQGRVFTLPYGSSLLLSAICFVAAGVQFYMGWETIFISLVIFFIVNLLSLVNLFKMKRVDE